MEGRGQIDHVEKRKDTKGREQPATKAARGSTHVCWQCGRRGKVGEVKEHYYASYDDVDVWAS
jgi:hypothetical protein